MENIQAQSQQANFSQESLAVLLTIYGLAVIIHIIAFIIHIRYVIPLQIKEANVKNGLRSLRVLMLASGITMLILNVVSIIVLTARFFIPAGDLYRYISVILVFTHAMGFLAFSIIKKQMYHTQFSEKQKELHERIEDLEHKRKQKKSIK